MNDAASAELANVVLENVPVELHLEARQRQEGLLRELMLMSLHEREEGTGAPQRLVELIDKLQAWSTDPQETAVARAAAQGATAIDLVYSLPVEAAEQARHLTKLLDELDDYSSQGRLLMPPTPGPVLRYRRWLLGQFSEQLDGSPPTPWAAAAEA